MKIFLDDLDVQESKLTEEIRRATLVLNNHPLYSSVRTMEDVRTYMYFQVWCVWDFMALLKSLQKRLLVDDIAWLPPKDGNIGAYLYEILLTEETDITDSGSGHRSHFETYVMAMEQAGADTGPINRFIEGLRQGKSLEESLYQSDIPQHALTFVQNTLKHAKSDMHESVSVFCLSREGIIPGMFMTLLSNFSLENDLSIFRWYLRRHIDVDSDSHGPLSVKLFNVVVGNDSVKLKEALEAALDALNARQKFLDAILNKLKIKSNDIQYEKG